jgi:ABC-type lipoprotein release transport system permease subunit
VPWGIIWAGAGTVMMISLLASIIPAWNVSRTEPLSLLQAGRAAA